jgi:hypothetical protein
MLNPSVVGGNMKKGSKIIVFIRVGKNLNIGSGNFSPEQP